MHLIRPKRWGWQRPSGGAQIDRGHPLARDLSFATLLGPGPSQDLISGVVGVPSSSSTTSSAGKWGSAHSYAGSYETWAAPSQPVAPPLSGLILLDNFTPSGFQIGIAVNGANGTSGGWSQHLSLLGGVIPYAFTKNNVADISSGVTLPTGIPVLAGFAVSASSVMFAINATTVTTANAAAFVAPTSPSVMIGSKFNNSATDALTGRVGVAYLWRRLLTADEFQWLYTDPYAFFQPQAPRRRLYLPASTVLFTVTVTPSLTTTTTLSRSVAHSLSASLSGAASCVRGVGHTLAASVSTSSSLARVVSKPLPLTSTTTASVSRAMSRNVAASLSTTATAVRTVRHALSASLATSTLVSFVGASVRNITIVSRTIASQLVSATRSRLRSSTRPSVFTSKTKP